MEWISVNDHLPKSDGFFNVICETDSSEHSSSHSFWFYKGRWCFDNEMSPGEPLFTAAWYVEVTHWMPLPEPSK